MQQVYDLLRRCQSRVGHADLSSAKALLQLQDVVTRQCHELELPGALVVTACSPTNSRPQHTLAMCIAAVSVLAHNGSFILQLPTVACAATLSSAAVCERFFGDVCIFRPAVTPAESSQVYLVATHCNRPQPEVIAAMVSALANTEAGTCSGGRADCMFMTHTAVPELLLTSWHGAITWAAGRAGADEDLVRAICSGTDACYAGKSWAALYGLPALTTNQVSILDMRA